MKMQRVALFGGSFDPPHRGHLTVLRGLLDLESIDQVWLLPTGLRVDKPSYSTPAARRSLAEIFLAENFAKDPRVRLELCQLTGATSSFTIDLLRYLRPLHPEVEFSFAIGADNLSSMGNWKESATLVATLPFIVIPRPGFATAPIKNAAGSFTPLMLPDTKLSSASSSEIRERIKNKTATAEFLTPAVAAYIQEHKLYE